MRTITLTVPIGLSNFFFPAPKKVQKYCAALKAVGGLISTSTLATGIMWLGFVGLTLCVIGETWEKLSADAEAKVLGVPDEQEPTITVPTSPNA